MGEDGRRGAQQGGKGGQKQLTQHADEDACRQCGEKAGGGHVGGLFKILPAQLPGDKVAAAVAKEKAHCLDDGHKGKNHAHGAGGAGVFQHPHKECVRHIIKGGNQHADDAGKSQPADQVADGLLRHLVKFLFLLIFHMFPLKRFHTYFAQV